MNLTYLTRIFVIVLVHIYAMRAPLQKPVFLHIQIYLVIAVVRLPAPDKDIRDAVVSPLICFFVAKTKITYI